MLTRLSGHSKVARVCKGISHTHCNVYNYEIKSHHVPVMQLHLPGRQRPSVTLILQIRFWVSPLVATKGIGILKLGYRYWW